jgi:hypothetical protein
LALFGADVSLKIHRVMKNTYGSCTYADIQTQNGLQQVDHDQVQPEVVFKTTPDEQRSMQNKDMNIFGVIDMTGKCKVFAFFTVVENNCKLHDHM